MFYFMFYESVFLRYLIPGLAASILFLGIFEITLRIKNERISWFHRIMVLAMGLYLTVIFSVTVSLDYVFSLEHFGQDINVVPFHELHMDFESWGNIMMFIPFGVLLVLLSKRCQKLYVTLFAGAALSLFIELLQLFSVRITDIDDLILNTAGTLCGFILGKLILLLIPSLRKMVGIIKIVDGKLYRKPNDAGSIVMLVILIFASVFATGFTHDEAKLQFLIPGGNRSTGTEQPVKADASEEITADITARNAYLWNISSNTVLYEKESNQQIAPASTVKMLTALTVLDFCDEKEQVWVGREVHLIAEDASRAWLNPGNELTIRQLFDALLLPSGNDAAYTLAVYAGRKICGDDTASIEEALAVFVEAMNEKAAEVGAADSNFISPDGYDASGQYTTAHDLACIAKGFWESSILRDIAGSDRIAETWRSGHEVTYTNTNELINPDSQYYYEYAVGLKTGKSIAAGCCLVSAAYIDDELYLCVVMGSTEEGRWTDSLALYREIK